MPRALKPDDRIAHYQVRGPLGAGGMGEVYRARDLSLPRDVALKILPPELTRSEERLRRFTLEAESASSLNHPHIVTIYEIGADRVHGPDGATTPDALPLHYISMELVEGRTLSTLIHDEQASLETLLGVLAQAAEGVAKAHAAGIVHRDLKPANIMVSSDGYAKVLDFGLAKLIEESPGGTAESQATTLAAGASSGEGLMIGTVGYMAPEQVQGKRVDARADVFAFGCILYEAATRQRPFAARSSIETLHRILHDAPTPVEELNSQVPAEVRRLIRRCLAKDPDQRPQSMRDLALELREIVDEYDQLPISGSASTPRVRVLRGGRGLRWLTAGVLGAAVVVVVWLATQPGRRDAPIVPRQITSNPPGLAVTACAISPDGRRVVYADPSGTYLKSIETGEIERLEIPTDQEVRSLAWYPDGTKLLLGRFQPGPRLTDSLKTWIYSIAGGRLRKLWDRGGSFAIASDGSRVAVTGIAVGDSIATLWVMGPDGENPTRVDVAGGLLYAPSWSPDGRRLAYVRDRAGEPGQVEVLEIGSGDTMCVARVLGSFKSTPVAWTHDDRIVIGMSESDFADATLWDFRIDRKTSRPIGKPHRLADTQGPSIRGLSASHEGSRLAYLQVYLNSDVYVAELEDGGRRLAGTRPLTRDMRYDWPMEWSSDSHTMLFISNRNGHAEIFRQGLAATMPERIVAARGEASSARFTPDGASVLFWLDVPTTPQDSSAMMRVGADGGPLEELPNGRTRGPSQCRCPRPPHRTCVVGEWWNGEFRFSHLDPVAGKGAEIGRVRQLDGGWAWGAWDLSPDGTHIVVASQDQGGGVLRIFDVATMKERVVRLSDGRNPQWVAWDARGEGWFVSNWRDLLRVEPDGRTFVIRHSDQWIGRPCVSPDGRLLAFGEQFPDANVWIVDRP